MLEIRSERGVTRPVLVRDEKNLILVDTSYPLLADLVLEAVRQAGSDPSAIDMILLTHQDIDHVGCLKDILARCPRAKAACHEDEAPYIRGDRTPVKYEALPENHELRLAYARRTVPVDRTLKDGELLPFCGGIRVLHTPGHTPGHLCLYVERARTLIAGDALNMTDGALSGPNPVYTKDMTQAYRSLEKLLPLQIEHICTFHGGAYHGDGNAALRALIAAGPKP